MENYHMRLSHKLHETRVRTGFAPLSLQCCTMFFGWAGHVGRMDQTCASFRLVCWRDLPWYRQMQQLKAVAPKTLIARMARAGKPMRWEDGLEEACGLSWKQLCLDRDGWREKKTRFALLRWHKCQSMRGKSLKNQSLLQHISGRMQVTCPRLKLGDVSILFTSGNIQICNQILGLWPVDHSAAHFVDVRHVQWILHALHVQTGLRTWTSRGVICHLPRAENTVAETISRMVNQSSKTFCKIRESALLPGDKILVSCEGALKNGCAAISCCMTLYRGTCMNVLSTVGCMVHCPSSLHAEFVAIILSVHVCLDWLRFHCTNRLVVHAGEALWRTT